MADWETDGVQKPGDDGQLRMTDHGEEEQNARLINKPEDLLELIMTADELQLFHTKQSQVAQQTTNR